MGKRRGGSRKVQKKVANAWSEEDVQHALHDLDSVPGASIRAVAKRHGVNESTIRFRIKKRQEGVGLGKPGRKCVFNEETEQELANCIGVVCNLGFSPTMLEIIDLVSQYISQNKIDAAQFKDGRPGITWVKNFMKRNKLTHKKAEMISTARKANTANPFIIYDFYDQLEKIFQKYPELDATRVWNCDESGFPTDPSKGRVVSVKGQRALKLRFGAGRENITALGVCNAAGIVLDPLIIFKGKNMQSTWYGENALPNTYYGKSENGWMDTGVFAEWFNHFADTVPERPLLLLLDGHLTHISIQVISRALEENIVIIKFPPHVTDVMQPLDVACFGPLKRRWEKLLQERVNTFGPKQQLSKSDFVNQLCSIWKDGMNKENVISGFQSTGIWPIDRTKYPKHRLDQRLVSKYEEWKKTGKELDWDHLAEENIDRAIGIDSNLSANSFEINVPSSQCATPTTTAMDFTSEPSNSQSTPSTNIYEKLKSSLGPYPYDAPAGFHWVPNGWKLEPIARYSTPVRNETSTKLFEKAFLDKMKGPVHKPKVKRMKLDLRAKVITQEELLKELERKKRANEENEMRKAERMEKRKNLNEKKNNLTKRKQAEKEESEEEEEEEESEEEVEESETCTDSSDESCTDENESGVTQVACWEALKPPTTEKELIGKFFACIYPTKKGPNLYVGKLTRRFLSNDEDGYPCALEIDCLQQKYGVTDCIFKEYDIAGADVEVFPIHNIVCGPLKCNFLGSKKWNFPQYKEFRQLFEKVKKDDREASHKNYLCKVFYTKGKE